MLEITIGEHSTFGIATEINYLPGVSSVLRTLPTGPRSVLENDSHRWISRTLPEFYGVYGFFFEPLAVFPANTCCASY